MKRYVRLVALLAASVIGLCVLVGCEDDVKRVKKVERHEESAPEMVAPGEPVVE